MNSKLENCFNTNVENPYGNYISVSSSPKKEKTCSNIESKKKLYQGSSFRPATYEYSDSFTRSYYTNPVTTVVNDQTSLAKYLYPDTGKCRNDGYSCKLNSSISKNKERIIIQSDYYKPNYLDIFGVYNSYK